MHAQRASALARSAAASVTPPLPSPADAAMGLVSRSSEAWAITTVECSVDADTVTMLNYIKTASYAR